MATYQHYVWAGGHFLFLLCALKYLLAAITFRAAGQGKYYSIAYVGAVVSYAIVCYKSLIQGPNQPGGALMRRALADENVQYLGLALFWWLSKPVAVSLVPFATFSLFHALTFVRSNVLPHFFPPSAPAAAGQAPQQHPILKKLQIWIKANYDPAMKVVAYTELLIFVRLVFGAILFQNSLLAPLIFSQFLKMRYFQSQFTQRAVGHVHTLIDGFVKKPGNPPILLKAWDIAQMVIGRLTGTVLTPQQPAGAAGGPRRQ